MPEHSDTIAKDPRLASKYELRGIFLREIGFDDYRAYLASDLWSSIRQCVIDRDKSCRICSKKAYTAHHVTYSKRVLLGKDLSQLFAICRACHRAIEFDGDKKLTSTSEIARKAVKRSRAKGNHIGKRGRRPVCRLCNQPRKRLGRSDICMPCYKGGRAVLAT